MDDFLSQLHDDDGSSDDVTHEPDGFFAGVGVLAIVLFIVQLALTAAFIGAVAWILLWVLQQFGVLMIGAGVLLA